jgi:hypothetical protein
MKAMDVPGIGRFEPGEYETLVSEPLAVAAFGGKRCRFELEGYAEDANPERLLQAVRSVLAATERLLLDATPHVHQYCLDMLALLGPEAPELDLERPEDVWKHVSLGDTFVVTRDHDDVQDAFVSLECNCAWEVEHGLQLVFKNGSAISKVGPFDGHVSNESAFDDETLRGVVYVRLGQEPE